LFLEELTKTYMAYRNQDLFAPLMNKVVRNIMERGLLGTTVVKMSFAARNSTGGLDTAM
jgi:hypothetical protein